MAGTFTGPNSFVDWDYPLQPDPAVDIAENIFLFGLPFSKN